MRKKRRKIKRSIGTRRYRKLLVIAVEGCKTEPQYFMLFNEIQSTFHVKPLCGRSESSPIQVLERMKSHLVREGLQKSDEAWLVVDRDHWPEQHLKKLHTWSESTDNYGFALTNPKFEYWLLLHFEDGIKISSSRKCSERLRKHIPHYDKGIDSTQFNLDRIKSAICRAKLRDNPPCTDWPRTAGNTTVYRLVEKIIKT